MAKRKAENTSIGDVLKDFIQSNHLEKGLDKVNVKDAWHKVMGNAISNYTTNVMLERKHFIYPIKFIRTCAKN